MPRNWCGSTVWPSRPRAACVSPISLRRSVTSPSRRFMAPARRRGSCRSRRRGRGRGSRRAGGGRRAGWRGPPARCRRRRGEGGGAGVLPVGAEGLDEGGQDEALDVGARGVVGAELVALAGAEGAFEQGAEDGGLDLAPVGVAASMRRASWTLSTGSASVSAKRPPLKRRTSRWKDGGEAAGVHRGPEGGEGGGDVLGGAAEL